MTIHELLTKRFATKSFDADKKVSQEDLAYILEAARLSSSSGNTQPWKIIVVTNPALREQLRPASFGQPQVVEASHLLVIATMKDMMAHVNTTGELIAEKAGPENAAKYVNMVKGWARPTQEQTVEWLSRQTYLALQAMMLAAIERDIDSCPMEGFNPAQYNELLGLTDCTATTLLPIGYAKEAGHPKVRIPLTDMVEERA